MATFNLIITYPDGEGPRILDALKARYATQANPNPNNAQAIESFRQGVCNTLRDIVKKHESDAAHAAAEASIVTVTPT